MLKKWLERKKSPHNEGVTASALYDIMSVIMQDCMHDRALLLLNTNNKLYTKYVECTHMGKRWLQLSVK